jgi:hypothetical protein
VSWTPFMQLGSLITFYTTNDWVPFVLLHIWRIQPEFVVNWMIENNQNQPKLVMKVVIQWYFLSPWQQYGNEPRRCALVLSIFRRAKSTKMPTSVIADQMAEERFLGRKQQTSIAWRSHHPLGAIPLSTNCIVRCYHYADSPQQSQALN